MAEIDRKWRKVEDGLPTESGWYLVFAPTYNGSKHKEFHDGLGFAKFTLPKSGKGWFSIDDHYSEENREIHRRWSKAFKGKEEEEPVERTYVKCWMPMPFPFEFGRWVDTKPKYDNGAIITQEWVEDKEEDKQC